MTEDLKTKRLHIIIGADNCPLFELDTSVAEAMEVLELITSPPRRLVQPMYGASKPEPEPTEIRMLRQEFTLRRMALESEQDRKMQTLRFDEENAVQEKRKESGIAET